MNVRTGGTPARRQRPPMRASEVVGGLWVVGYLVLMFALFTALAAGPLERFDVFFNDERLATGWRPLLLVVDRIGQRAVCLPILAAVCARYAWRYRTWRPVVIAVGSVVLVNLVVLVLKLVISRPLPSTGDPSFFDGGIIYPSGHTANVMLVYGLVAWLVMRYGHPGRLARQLLVAMVVVLSIVMVATSLILRWHWLTDLIGGLMVGGIVLQLVVTVNAMVPAGADPVGWLRRHRRRPVGEEQPAAEEQRMVHR